MEGMGSEIHCSDREMSLMPFKHVGPMAGTSGTHS